MHQELHAEDHCGGGAGLHALAVHLQPHAELLHVADFVGRDEPGAERAESRAALALHPLSGAFHLVGAFGDVVADAEAGDDIHRLFLRHVRCALANDDGEFDFPIRLFGALRQHHVIVGTNDTGRRLVEQNGLFWNRGARFGRVIREVQAHRNEVANIANAGAEPRPSANQWQLLRLQPLQLGQRFA